MKTVEVADATASLAEYARAAAIEPVIVTQQGQPIAAVFPIENADWESIRLSTDPQFLKLIEESRERSRKEGRLSSEEMRQRLGITADSRVTD